MTISRDCKKGTLICFHYNQVGHKKVDCLNLCSGAVTTPTPSPLRITESREDKTESPILRILAFQLTTEEARSALDVVTGMFSLLYLLLFSW